MYGKLKKKISFTSVYHWVTKWNKKMLMVILCCLGWRTIYEGELCMKVVLMEYQRADYAGGRLSTRGDYTWKSYVWSTKEWTAQGGDYPRGGGIHENRTYGVPKSGLRRGKTIYEGGLYMKIVRMEYQRVDCAGGRLSTRGDYTWRPYLRSTKEQTMQGETIYEGGLYMKILVMEYQRADYAGGLGVNYLQKLKQSWGFYGTE